MSAWYQEGFFITPASGQTVIPITGGRDPKAIHTFTAINTADQTIQANAASNHGFSIGSTLGDFATLQHREANAATNTQRASTSGDAVHIRNPVNDVILVQGAVTFTPTDVTITYDTFAAGHIVHYEIWGGDAVQANLQMVVANASPHTGVGFTPKMVLMSTSGNLFPTPPGSTTSIHAYQSYGVAYDGTTIDQWCIFTYMGDNDLDAIGSGATNVDVAGQYDVDFASWQIQLTSFDVDGITWAGTNADEIMMLFLTFDDEIEVQVDRFTKSVGAAPAVQDFQLDFDAQGVYLATACQLDEVINVDRDSNHCHGAFSTLGGAAHSFLTTADNADSADSHSRSDSARGLQISQNLNALGVEAAADVELITGPGLPQLRLTWNPNDARAVFIYIIAYQAQGLHHRPVVVNQAVNRAGTF